MAGCQIGYWLEGYAQGYNSISKERLLKKYSKDIFRECADQARKEWEAEHPEEQ